VYFKNFKDLGQLLKKSDDLGSKNLEEEEMEEAWTEGPAKSQQSKEPA